MIISGHQPNYLPWLGYFHKMMSCDLFIILDDVLHSKGAITNKNKIKGPEGDRLLSIPLARKKTLIKDTIIIKQHNWQQKHFNSMQTCYAKASYWKEYKDYFLPIYENPGENLADLNLRLIQVVRDLLDIKTPMIRSSQLQDIPGTKGTKIINLCKHLGADICLSGIGARTYNDDEEFKKNNLRLVYQEFEHPIYPQLWGKFIPNMSAVDLLFNCGPESKYYLSRQVM